MKKKLYAFAFLALCLLTGCGQEEVGITSLSMLAGGRRSPFQRERLPTSSFTAGFRMPKLSITTPCSIVPWPLRRERQMAQFTICRS
jgi:hypothetical protein